MTLRTLEELGHILCDVIHFAKKNMDISGLERFEKVCDAILPDLSQMHEDGAKAAASAAYDMAKRVKEAFSP